MCILLRSEDLIAPRLTDSKAFLKHHQVMQEARASTAIVLNMFAQDIPVPAPDGLSS